MLKLSSPFPINAAVVGQVPSSGDFADLITGKVLRLSRYQGLLSLVFHALVLFAIFAQSWRKIFL
jgi:hypothetical protein